VKQPIILAIDAGTSKIKCVAFTTQGELLASRSCSNSYETLSDGGAVQSMLATREKVIATLILLIEELGNDAENVCSITVTAQGDGLLLTDEAGEPLHNGWLWLDSRAANIAREIESDAAYETIYTTSLIFSIKHTQRFIGKTLFIIL